MKTLRYTCAAIILTLALAVSILAGEVDCPGVVAPPPSPPPPTTTSSITTTVILAIVSLIK